MHLLSTFPTVVMHDSMANVGKILLLLTIAVATRFASVTSSSFANPSASSAFTYVPHFAVEPENVQMVDSHSVTRSAVFTCLLTQPVAANSDRSSSVVVAGTGTAMSWFYNSLAVDATTDKIRIPLANGSLYVSTATIEHPPPTSPLDDVPLPTAKGYNCRAATVFDYDGKKYNVTVVSRVAHVVKAKRKRHNHGLPGGRTHRLAVETGDAVVLVCGGSFASSRKKKNNPLLIDARQFHQNEGQGYIWFRDDVPFPEGDKLPQSAGLVDNGRILELHGMSNNDFGEYVCLKAPTGRRNAPVSRFIISRIPSQQTLSSYSQPAVEFLVRPKEHIEISEPTEKAAEASSAILLCSAVGFAKTGAAAISWLKNGVQIIGSKNSRALHDPNGKSTSNNSTDTRFSKLGHGSLLIQSLTTQDSGVYTCRASVKVGEATIFADANVRFDVIVAPRYCSSQETPHSRVIVGTVAGSVDLECGIQNAENVFWFHNGRYLVPALGGEQPQQNVSYSESGREFFYDYGQRDAKCGHHLHLWALTEKDSGIYQCFVANTAGLLSSSMFLAVNSSPYTTMEEFVSPAATILRDDLENGDTAPKNVHKVSSSDTSVRIAWEVPILSADAVISGYVVFLRSVTALSKTEAPTDRANRFRRLFAADNDIDIDRLAPGRKYEISVAVAYKRGNETKLTVGVVSHPIVVFTDKVKVGNNREASTKFGPYRWLQKPRNLHVELENPTGVKVTWIPPPPPGALNHAAGQLRSSASTRSLPNIERYRLFYRTGSAKSDNQEAFIDLPGHQTSHVLASLQPNTPYTFYVRAGMMRKRSSFSEATSLILGPASRDVTVWIPSAAPASSPQRVEAIATGPSSIDVKWQPPPEHLQNGLITGYTVLYQPKPRSPSAFTTSATYQEYFNGRTAITDGATTTVTLTDGIAPSREYEIRVAAINTNGTGPLSSSVYVTTAEQQLTEFETPGAPFAFTARSPSPDKIILSWQPPSSASSVIVRGYYISFGVGEPYRNQIMVDATQTEHVLTNLRASAEYIISLRSYNNYGYGPEVFQAVRTQHLPKDRQQTDIGSNAGIGDFGDPLPHKKPNHRRPANFARTPLDVPLGVKAFTLSDSAMLVSWTDPNEHYYRSGSGHRQREHHVVYTVRYGPLLSLQLTPDKDGESSNHAIVPSSPMRWRHVNSTLPSVRIHSLEPFQEYEFAVRIIRVAANNPSQAQTSDWSMSATNITFDAPPGDAPRDVKVTIMSSTVSSKRGTAVRVSWQPPLKPNGIISGYIVSYSVHNANRAERDWQVIGVSGDRFSVLIRRLQPDTVYYFKVQAKNGRGYGPPSMPLVRIRTPRLSHMPVVLTADENNDNSQSVVMSPQPQHRPDSSHVDLAGGELSAENEPWPFQPSFFENQMLPQGNSYLTKSSTGTLIATTVSAVELRETSSYDDDDAVMASAGANTLWLAVSAAIGALLVCAVASIAVFVCRKLSSPRSNTTKKLRKSESAMPNGGPRLTANGGGKGGDACNGGNGLPTATSVDMWAMRDQLELRQQLIPSADMQSAGGGGAVSVLGMSEDNSMADRGSSMRHREQQGQSGIRTQLYHIDPYENETVIMGEDGRQATTSMVCSPTGQSIAYQMGRQSSAATNSRLFGVVPNSRTSSATMSCQESYPLLTNGYRHATPNNGANGNDGENYVVDMASTGTAVGTGRLGGARTYHMQHRASPASSCAAAAMNMEGHHHHQQMLLHQRQQQQQQHLMSAHQTLPRLSIATMPSPGPQSVHQRYEPLLTTTSSGSSANHQGYLFACPPSAQTPDSGFDDHNLHLQMQQQQQQLHQRHQRTSLSSSSYGGGSVSSSTTNNIAPFASRQQQQQHQSNLSTSGEPSSSPSTGSNSLSTSTERPRLSSFQPLTQLSTSSNGTPSGAFGNGNKSSFLHLSRVLPPTPGQVRSGIAQPNDRISSATLSSSSPITTANGTPNGNNSCIDVGAIHLPPPLTELQSTAAANEDLVAAAEMSCLDGLMKDLKLNVATSSSVTLTGTTNSNSCRFPSAVSNNDMSNNILAATSKMPAGSIGAQ